MGMLVIGSTISPLMVISISMACSASQDRCLPTSNCRLSRQAVRPGPPDRHRHRPPDPVGGAAAARPIGRDRKVHYGVPRRPARHLAVAPPARRIDEDVHHAARPPPRAAASGSPAAATAAPRCAPSSPSSLTSSGIRFDASVFGRAEYLNENMLWYRAASVSDSVCSKSSAVSPGKPTIISVDSVTPGIASRMRATRSRYSSRVCRRRIAASTRVEPDCTGRCRCLQTFGRSRTASISRAPGVARMRAREPDPLDAGHVVDLREQLREVAAGIVRRLVVIDDLPEELNLAAARSRPPRARRPGCPPSRASARGRACTGTTQNAQWSLHPSMIVTYALTGSPRRVMPSGNVTSSHGLMSTSANADCGRLLDEHRQHLQPLRADDDVDDVAVGLLEQRVRLPAARRSRRRRRPAVCPVSSSEHAQLARAACRASPRRARARCRC